MLAWSNSKGNFQPFQTMTLVGCLGVTSFSINGAPSVRHMLVLIDTGETYLVAADYVSSTSPIYKYNEQTGQFVVIQELQVSVGRRCLYRLR